MRGRESPSDMLAAHTTTTDDLCDAVKRALIAGLADEKTSALVRDALHVDTFGEADDDRYSTLADAVEAARRDGLFPHL